MHFSVKKIDEKKYYYATDAIYITKGKGKTKIKSLGRVENSLEEVAKNIADFENQVVEEEAKERCEYWGAKVKNKKGFGFGILESLEKLRSSLFRGREYLKKSGQERLLEAAFSIDFVYNSNKLEGSRIPRKTIEEMVKKGGRKNDEVSNSLNALNYVKDSNNLFTIRNIIKLHKLLLSHEPAKHGIRKEPIIVGNSETLPFEKVPMAMSELLDWLKKTNYKMYPPELAFEFYYRFERIHPFKDGNGRIGRLLMNNILKEHRYHPIIIWDNNRESHMNVFEKAIDGSMHKYFRFMCEQMRITYYIYSKKIEKAAEIEKSINDTFFTPSR